jgi:hypothetical protein
LRDKCPKIFLDNVLHLKYFKHSELSDIGDFKILQSIEINSSATVNLKLWKYRNLKKIKFSKCNGSADLTGLNLDTLIISNIKNFDIRGKFTSKHIEVYKFLDENPVSKKIDVENVISYNGNCHLFDIMSVMNTWSYKSITDLRINYSEFDGLNLDLSLMPMLKVVILTRCNVTNNIIKTCERLELSESKANLLNFPNVTRLKIIGMLSYKHDILGEESDYIECGSINKYVNVDDICKLKKLDELEISYKGCIKLPSKLSYLRFISSYISDVINADHPGEKILVDKFYDVNSKIDDIVFEKLKINYY